MYKNMYIYKIISFHINICKTHGKQMAKERTKLTVKAEFFWQIKEAQNANQ